MTAPAFDEVVHAPHRLRIMAALAVAESVEFAAIREMLGVADSVLSKHLKVLQDAGYVVLDRPVRRGGRVRTWVRPSPEGRRAYDAHVAALLELMAAPGSAPHGERSGRKSEARQLLVASTCSFASCSRAARSPLS